MHAIHPFIKAAKKKPDRWKSIEDAKLYFNERKLFAGFDREVFDLFINECFVHNAEGGVSLLFSSDIESQIYYKAPVDIPGHWRKDLGLFKFKAPCFFVYEKSHGFLSKMDVLWMKHAFKGVKVIPYEGSHFWPLENPKEFSEKIFALIETVE